MNYKNIISTLKSNINILFSFLLHPSYLKSFLPFPFFLLTSSFLLITCSQPTENNKVTYSGTVTLADTTDFSGVTVSLYAPVELDTALVRINREYPNIGVQISQETEFDHREHEPLYTTKTAADGSWEIKAPKGNYNLVAEKEGWGWKPKINISNIADLNLKKAIIWNNSFTEPVEIPEDSYIKVTGNTTFYGDADLTVGSGSILDFYNNARLELQAELITDGNLNNPIRFTASDADNSAKLRIDGETAVTMRYVLFYRLGEGIYITDNPDININSCLFRDSNIALELRNCQDATIENSLFAYNTEGISANDCYLNVEKCVFIRNSENGINTANAQNSMYKNNVITQCIKNGMGINAGGYAYETSNLSIQQNDFINNGVHFYIGVSAFCDVNANNFGSVNSYIVSTTVRVKNDTLNFRNNYWGLFDNFSISEKIRDREDWEGDNYKGPVIDYSEFYITKVIW